MTDRNVAPIIIKRKKFVVEGTHHGGAWKIAYADFVTAMMAFFLIMWLMNATTEQQRKGIADYFSPSVPISRVSGGGDSAFGGDSIFSEDHLIHDGTGATMRHPDRAMQARGETGFETAPEGAENADPLREIEERLLGRTGESLIPEEMRKHIVTRVTDEGLVIELYANEGAPLFEAGTDTPTEMMRDLITVIVDATAQVKNGVAVAGHMRARPVMVRENPVWPLSLARAERSRELLLSSGMDAARIQRVTGHADRDPATANPMERRNDRIEVTLLRGPMN